MRCCSDAGQNEDSRADDGADAEEDEIEGREAATQLGVAWLMATGRQGAEDMHGRDLLGQRKRPLVYACGVGVESCGRRARCAVA